jgi:Fe-S-cluster containining protein
MGRPSDGEEDSDTSTLNELERQVERGSLFTHTALSDGAQRTAEVEAVVFGLIEALVAKGVTSQEAITKSSELVRAEMEQRGEIPAPGLALRVEQGEDDFVPVNCNERMHICKAVCCRLSFALSAGEVEAGRVKWDLGAPYHIRQESSGYCVHNNRATGGCGVYESRPGICRRYSCANDERIWTDFEKMQLNETWIEEHLGGSRPRLARALMMMPRGNETSDADVPEVDEP